MGKFNLASIARNAQSTLTKHGPEILIGFGIVGMAATTVLAVKATPKALRLIEEAKQRKPDKKLTKMETVKACWKCYIPAAVSGITSTACLVGASTVNVRRNAALATAYTLSETALKEYQEKVIETVGEETEKEVREKVVKERLKKDPVSSHEEIVTERGDELCYDYYFGRYFKSNPDTIEKAINAINRNIVVNMYASLNDFYDEIGLSQTKIGDHMGWNIDDGEIGIELSSHITEDGRLSYVIEYSKPPKYNYSSFC